MEIKVYRQETGLAGVYANNKTVIPALIEGWKGDPQAEDENKHVVIACLDEPLEIGPEAVVTDVIYWYDDDCEPVNLFVGYGSYRVGENIYIACLHIRLAESFPAKHLIDGLKAAKVEYYWPQYID